MKLATLAAVFIVLCAGRGEGKRTLLDNDMSSVSYTYSPSPSDSSPSSPSPSSPSDYSPSPSSDSPSSPSPSSPSDYSPSPSSPSPSSPSGPQPKYTPTIAEETPATNPSSSSKRPATSADGCQTALSFLESNPDFSMLLKMVNATPAKAHLHDILSSPDVSITLLAPIDWGVNRTLNANGLSFEELLADPALVLEVLQYHMFPNTVPSDGFQDMYSFNTLLPGPNFQQSVTIGHSGDGHTVVHGAKNDAQLLDTGTSTCLSIVYTTTEMLLPATSVAAAPADSATEAAVALPAEAVDGEVDGSADLLSSNPHVVVGAIAHAPAHAPTKAPAKAPAAAVAHKLSAAASAPVALAPAVAKGPAVAVAKPAVKAPAPKASALPPSGLVTATKAATAAAVVPDGAVAAASLP
eukprot:jgi/Botrbrau1/21818/Bobra.0190s0035.1